MEPKNRIIQILSKKDPDNYPGERLDEILEIITDVFHIRPNQISDIEVLKTGMTNDSFVFRAHNHRYIMRIPGKGTENLINRSQEKSVYEVLSDYSFSDCILYFDEKKGYKITEYIEGAHNLDPYNEAELQRCMKLLKSFHQENLKVNHSFDMFERIEYYESLWNRASVYPDYSSVKQTILRLKPIIEAFRPQYRLCHIDSVHDNFLITKDEVRCIDFEYSGMQDSDLDLAMFCIYAMYDRKHIDRLIDIYYEETCELKTRYKIYAYIAIAGLLWSNWCEYKMQLGIHFGEYAEAQYRFAKDYYKILSLEAHEIPPFESLRNEE